MTLKFFIEHFKKLAKNADKVCDKYKELSKKNDVLYEKYNQNMAWYAKGMAAGLKKAATEVEKQLNKE